MDFGTVVPRIVKSYLTVRFCYWDSPANQLPAPIKDLRLFFRFCPIFVLSLPFTFVWLPDILERESVETELPMSLHLHNMAKIIFGGDCNK
jgi:hypothetical protein